ncbi:MauE/DoxX family redox-associated membrane protein [Chitinophaga japonensis]|uniref:Methylamine utilisation protein MauE domain-containing protein n=1 Tax=Chitinophaga japonensis TaxID=104662 RepID=A0A562T4B6_CHIJA|nr:MauE/DoxX family redox-associated membrane protein [Chitinophaga japonensis]TWI87906.1 hypothetical protein LX66_1980 [Chitinophaga japonensis]
MKKISLVIITFLLTILFIYAPTVKALEYGRFIDSMGQSPLLAGISKPLLAPVVLGVEYLIVILLNIPATRRLGLYASFFVMLTFSVYLVTLFYFFDNIPCSCGGILGYMSYPTHIAFNIFFTLLSLAGIFLSRKPDTKPGLQVVV